MGSLAQGSSQKNFSVPDDVRKAVQVPAFNLSHYCYEEIYVWLDPNVDPKSAPQDIEEAHLR